MLDTIMDFLAHADPGVGRTIRNEFARQQQNVELIASENIVSPAVMAALGTCLTNKYAEGYPGKRYYGGCGMVDETKSWHGSGPAACLALTTPTFSLIRAPTPIWPPILPPSSRATLSWA